MAHEHTSYVDGCFTCKVRTLQFGRGESNRRNYVDTEAVEQLFGGKEEQARVLEETQGVGWLKPSWGPWKKDKNAPGGAKREGELFKLDRKTGDYVPADPGDTDKVLFGERQKEKRSFGTSSRGVSKSDSP